MKGFDSMEIKKIASKINYDLQTIILTVLSCFLVFAYLYGERGAYNIILESILVLLILAAVWILYLSKATLASYFVLLLSGYISGFYMFFNWILSFTIQFRFPGTFPWVNLILMFGSVYLVIMIVSLLFKDGFKFYRGNFTHYLLFLLFSILMFLEGGITYLVIVLLIEFVACNYKPLASCFLMLSKTIVFPFSLGRSLYLFGYKNVTFGTWFLTVIALIVISLIAIDLFKTYKNYLEDKKDFKVTIES